MSDQNTEAGLARAAGWYHAEGDPAGTQRYWDGNAWQGGPQVAPDAAMPAAGLAAPPTVASVMAESSADDGYKGFFPTLFDFSLSSFLAPKVIRILYILAVVVICLVTAVLAIVALVNGGGFAGILAGLVVIPLGGLLYLLLLRIQAEFVIVSFRTYEQMRSMRAEFDQQS